MKNYYFKTQEEILLNLQELGILGKKDTLDNLIFNGKPCKVIGFNYKYNPVQCIHPVYMNLIVEQGGIQFNVNITYIKSMNSTAKVGETKN